MPQIIILRPPRTGRAAEIGLNADVTVIEGGSRVDLQNASDVLIVSRVGQTEIYTDQEARDKIQSKE